MTFAVKQAMECYATSCLTHLTENLMQRLRHQCRQQSSTFFLTYETEFFLFLAMLENSVLPMG